MKLATASLLILAGLCALPQPDSVSPPSAAVKAHRVLHRYIPGRASRGVRRVPLTAVRSVTPRHHGTVQGGGQRTPLNWPALAQCESSGNPRAVSMGRYFGLYQFDLQTWGSVGGVGNPADASPTEQTARAQQLYDKRGPAPWPVCGWHLLEAS